MQHTLEKVAQFGEGQPHAAKGERVEVAVVRDGSLHCALDGLALEYAGTEHTSLAALLHIHEAKWMGLLAQCGPRSGEANVRLHQERLVPRRSLPGPGHQPCQTLVQLGAL